ncbi:hypothetical protein HanRHA438_Chr02g0093671 [Helianthus annuus]|nr:hypothetical protein HanRHA438_Chr02g0093671 [Helianthus annuus]
MKPKNFPSSMPNEHLAGFNFIFTLRKELNVFSMSFNIWSSSGLLTTRSSIYTSICLPISPAKVLSIKRWYVTPAFLRPNGIFV